MLKLVHWRGGAEVARNAESPIRGVKGEKNKTVKEKSVT